jgi:hypothetical protein
MLPIPLILRLPLPFPRITNQIIMLMVDYPGLRVQLDLLLFTFDAEEPEDGEADAANAQWAPRVNQIHNYL